MAFLPRIQQSCNADPHVYRRQRDDDAGCALEGAHAAQPDLCSLNMAPLIFDFSGAGRRVQDWQRGWSATMSRAVTVAAGRHQMAKENERAEELETRYEREEQEDSIGTGHWIEYLAGQRRTSMLVDPPSGQLPPKTPGAEALYKAGRSSWTPNTSFNWVTDFDSWDR